MGYKLFQWESACQSSTVWKPVNRSKPHLVQLITSVRFRDWTKFAVIAPAVLPPKHGEVAAFIFLLQLLFILMILFTDQMCRPIFDV